jgi:hypothetical protein
LEKQFKWIIQKEKDQRFYTLAFSDLKPFGLGLFLFLNLGWSWCWRRGLAIRGRLSRAFLHRILEMTDTIAQALAQIA